MQLYQFLQLCYNIFELITLKCYNRIVKTNGHGIVYFANPTICMIVYPYKPAFLRGRFFIAINYLDLFIGKAQNKVHFF